MGCNNGSDFNRWMCAKLKESQKEQRICLNDTEFVPLDVNNPTTEEVKTWCDANLNYVQKNNGTQIVYYVGDYEPYQGDINIYFSNGAEDLSITFVALNGHPIFPRAGHEGEVIKIKENGVYVYNETLLKNLVESWLTSNGYEGTLEPPDLNNETISISHIKGGLLEVDYGYYEDGDSYVDHFESQAVSMIPGNGGTCDEPDYIWTLNNEEIELSDKRVFNAKTVYVDSSGSDETGKRGYRNFPFKTLNAALTAIQNGDTLHVFPGDYTSSVTVSKYFNIYCEDGVNWDMTVIMLPQTGLNNTLYKLDWRFDNLYSSNYSILEWKNVVGINFINIEINELQNIRIGLGAAESNFKIKKLSRGATIDGNSYHKTDTTIVSPYNNIIIDHLTRINNSTISTPVRSVNTNNANMNVEINNIHIIGGVGADSGIITILFPGIDNGTYKNITSKINNCRFYPTDVYTELPQPFDNRLKWRDAYPSGTSNQVLWIRQGWSNGTNINFELKNYRGSGYGAVINGWHYDTTSTSPTQQRILKANIQGYWEKSAPVSIGWWGDLTGVNQPLNTTVEIELDVICDEAPGVMFFWYGSHPSNRFIISGRIVTKRTGMPCITLNNAYNSQEPTNGNFNSNGTILLKDLIMINDGTVAPIAINPLDAQVQEVSIMNVKSNSLITDANITEVGESITRNLNYK